MFGVMEKREMESKAIHKSGKILLEMTKQIINKEMGKVNLELQEKTAKL